MRASRCIRSQEERVITDVIIKVNRSIYPNTLHSIGIMESCRVTGIAKVIFKARKPRNNYPLTNNCVKFINLTFQFYLIFIVVKIYW